jgi:hypothetical protein
VGLFKQYDVNGNNSIDKHEARKVLLSLEMDSSIEKAKTLLGMIDKDHTGEIDFEEFCRFFVMLKLGDNRLNEFKPILSKLSKAPLGRLEYQSKVRGLTTRFIVTHGTRSTVAAALYTAEVS